MPKDPGLSFSNPNNAPYLSVCSTSSHDMTTLRGWWEEDREKIQEFYNHQLGQSGEAPAQCEPWIVELIVNQHLDSPAMWAVFPIQDLLAIDGLLKLEDPHAERINVPGNRNHYWQYRMHLSIEVLLKEKDFNNKLKTIIQSSGR
jgi:4-alpha-glucanotransferase